MQSGLLAIQEMDIWVRRRGVLTKATHPSRRRGRLTLTLDDRMHTYYEGHDPEDAGKHARGESGWTNDSGTRKL